MAKIYLPIADNGGGSVKANYMAALIGAVSESGLHIQVARASDSLASRAMNAVTNNFLSSDCDELLIIDCDIIVTADDLRNLCSHDVPLVYGPYVKRHPKMELCLASLVDYEGPKPGEVLWEVRRAGRGCVRIKRELLERMKEDNGGEAKRYHNHGRVEWDFWPTELVEGDFCTAGQGKDADGFPIREYLSEDFAFCDRARRMGVPILVDTRITLQHEGDCVFPIRYTKDILSDILCTMPSDDVDSAIERMKSLRG